MARTRTKKNDREAREKARDEHKQQPADETIAAGEHMDLEQMDDALEAERQAGSPAPTGLVLPAPSTSQNPYLSEELQGMELESKTFGPPQYGSPDPASAASRLMTLEDGHPLAGVQGGTAAISEDYGVQYADTEATEVEATDGAKKLAKEKGIDLSSVEGSGEDGKVTKPDVEKALEGSGREISNEPDRQDVEDVDRNDDDN